jgi:tRNA (adenine57-N1/adenine58-N1)-methyltransferase catalytic subunit
MRDTWREGEAASLKRPGEPAIVLRIARGAQRIGTEGVLDVSGQLGKPPGGEVEWLGATYRLVRPSLSDLLGSLRRGAQIVTVKDALYLGYLAGVGPGARVIEAGTGSGALTIALAFAVGPSGRVITYDRRADFLKVAERNVRDAGLSDRVSFRERDVAENGFDESAVGSVLLDLPEPWPILPAARSALDPGGYVATYSPTYNQLERTVCALREEGFDEVRAVELIERAIHVGEGGTRPEFDMLGHTGFLASGRRVA